MKRIVTALLMALMAVGCWAQTAMDKELERAFEIMKYREMMVETMKGQFQAFAAQGAMSEEKIEGLTAEIVDAMLPELKSAIKKVYKETFTLEELKQLNEWMSSPIGQKSLSMSSKASVIGTEVSMNPDVQAKVQQIVMKYFAK